MAETFSPPHYGYRMDIPKGWQIDTPRPYTVILTPPSDASTGFDTVAVINLHRDDSLAPHQAAVKAANDYAKELLAKAKNGKILRQASFRWDMGDTVLAGQQVVASFTDKGLPIRQWAVFLPNPKASIIHLWQYTATAGRFEAQLPKARTILDSLQPVSGEQGKTPSTSKADGKK